MINIKTIVQTETMPELTPTTKHVAAVLATCNTSVSDDDRCEVDLRIKASSADQAARNVVVELRNLADRVEAAFVSTQVLAATSPRASVDLDRVRDVLAAVRRDLPTTESSLPPCVREALRLLAWIEDEHRRSGVPT